MRGQAFVAGAKPVLRLYRGSGMGASGELDSSSTLSDVFERAFLPIWITGQSLDAKTETLYREALNWWVRLTGDPPLGSIDDLLIADFLRGLRDSPGRKSSCLSAWTVRKHATAISKLLDFCGPRSRDRRSRQNLGLVEFPPLVPRPRACLEPVRRVFSVDELRRMYAAADQMGYPEVPGSKTPAWWRSLLHACYATGLRIGALMSLKWGDLILDAFDGRHYLRASGAVSKGGKGIAKYCPPELRESIDAIRCSSRPWIWRWSDARWEINWITRLLHRLQEHAGIPAERRWGWHGFRRANASAIALQGGMSLAQSSLGHGDMTVTQAHYVGDDVQRQLLAAAVDALPSLSAGDRQGKLFE